MKNQESLRSVINAKCLPSVAALVLSSRSLNLGYSNGWGEAENTLFRALIPFAVENSHYSRKVGRCIEESHFQVSDGVDTLTVYHGSDSSD